MSDIKPEIVPATTKDVADAIERALGGRQMLAHGTINLREAWRASRPKPSDHVVTKINTNVGPCWKVICGIRVGTMVSEQYGGPVQCGECGCLVRGAQSWWLEGHPERMAEYCDAWPALADEL